MNAFEDIEGYISMNNGITPVNESICFSLTIVSCCTMLTAALLLIHHLLYLTNL